MQHRMRMCSGMHRIQYILHGGKRNLLGEKNKDMSATMYTEGQAILAKLAKARLVGCTTCRKWSFHFIAVAAVFADRKSTRLNSSHANISYAVFCLKKKNDK